MMKVCEDRRFFFGQADLLLAYLDTLHQKGHVAAKGAHGLQALGIFLDLLGRAAVDHVPILLLATGIPHMVKYLFSTS